MCRAIVYSCLRHNDIDCWPITILMRFDSILAYCIQTYKLYEIMSTWLCHYISNVYLSVNTGVNYYV